ncbi:MAG: hypothetical protein RKH07_00990 [Gammaproteobacteria bacterium]
MKNFESTDKQHQPKDDVAISLGVDRLLCESTDLLQETMSTIQDPQVRRAINDIVQHREAIHQQLLSTIKSNAERKSNSLQGAEDSLGDRHCYEQIRRQAANLTETELLWELQKADRTAAGKLREAVKAVSNSRLANRLASAVARFQMSSDKLKAVLQSSARY